MSCFRLLFAAALLAALPLPAAALDGRVVDERTSAPIAGATVTIVGLTGAVTTDADGRFRWTPDPAPPLQIIVVLPSGRVARPVVVERIDPAAPLLIPVSAVLEEAVTVSGLAPSVATTPATAATMLSGREIARRTPTNLMQALEGVAGVSQVSEGHAAVPAIRGMARGRTLILIDGARVSSERRVGPSATFLDPATVEGIDVARGPGSVAYGSDALGGVISVRTRRAEPGSAFRARLTGTLGAAVPERRGSIELSKGLRRGGVLVQAHVRQADDYDSPDGPVFNSGWKDRGLLVRADHEVGRGVLSVGWQSDFGRDVERPRDNSRTVRFFYPYEDSHRLTASYELHRVGGFERVAFTTFLGTYDQRTEQDRFATPVTGRRVERADISAQDFHVKGHAERNVGPMRVSFGLDVNGRYGLEALDVFRSYDASGRLAGEDVSVSVDNARRTDTGAYVQASLPLAPVVQVSGGARVDRVTSRNRGGYFGDFSTAHTAGAGFGAISLGPFRGFSVTTQLSRGFRDPVLSDRYYRGPTGRGFITGNPALDPETSLQFDVAARQILGRTRIAAYAFQYRIDDLVERYQTDPDFFFFRNRGRARLRGVEGEVQWELAGGWSVETAAQLARGVALDDGAALDDMSADLVSFTVRREWGARGFAQARTSLVAEDGRPGPSEVRTPGYTLVDLGAGWQVNGVLEVRGAVRNLLDRRYYASPDARWVLAPGRAASVTTVVGF